MLQDLEQVEYRHGFLGTKMKPDSLRPQVWRRSKIPAEVRKAIREQDLLNLGGVHGLKDAGDPQEYDELRLLLTEDTVEIVVWNRGITLMNTDDEKVKRIHRVLSMLTGEK